MPGGPAPRFHGYVGAPRRSLLLLLLLTLCSVCPPDSCDCGLLPVAFVSNFHSPCPPCPIPLGGLGHMEVAGNMSLQWDMGTHRHFTLCPLAPMAFSHRVHMTPSMEVRE